MQFEAYIFSLLTPQHGLAGIVVIIYVSCSMN